MNDDPQEHISGSPRDLPSVDEVLRTPEAAASAAEFGLDRITELVRSVLDGARAEIIEKPPSPGLRSAGRPAVLDAVMARFNDALRKLRRDRSGRVINATGVAIHTNLGRAPLSAEAVEAISAASGYTPLEFDLETGRRGPRGSGAELLISDLTGAEAALVVNNCAAAAFLVLSELAAGGEVVISRGELVEIGGDFRVPDVLAASGAVLREVGTTNRTKLADYERTIGDRTALVLRVHPSNYRIVGFTAAPSDAELAGLAHAKGLSYYVDAGSGALVDLSHLGLDSEPVVPRLISDGADLVTFSGDKLLGGPQAGIVTGRRVLIDRLRKNPLYRVLRTSKTVYAALEATLSNFARGTAFSEIPVLRMLSMTEEELSRRANAFAKMLSTEPAIAGQLRIGVVPGASAVGGGSAPGVPLATLLVALSGDRVSADELAARLRDRETPVIARIAEGRVVLDLRTVFEDEVGELFEAVRSAISRDSKGAAMKQMP